MNTASILKNNETPLAKHPIQVVARRTGLSADVIRAWERRYNAVSPQRSPTSRRLYSDEDVERLTLLCQATQGGRRIGDVAQLSLTELRQLVQTDAAAVAQAPGIPIVQPEPESSFDQSLQTCLTTVQELEPLALESALAEAARALSTPVLLNELIGPLLNLIGEQWRTGLLRICHEHMATAQLRSFLGTLVTSSNMTGTGPGLIIATPVGQRHELGALMAAVTAAIGGWNPLYLGPHIPSDDIAFAASEKKVRAVALSISYPADDPHLPESLRRLRRQLPEDVNLLVGGAASCGYRDVLAEIGALQPENLESLRVELDAMRVR